MAKPGKKRTPTTILKLRGSWRAKIRGPDYLGEKKRPQRPEWLEGEARKCWERLMPKLYAAGLLTELNRETLALMCSAWGDFVDAERQLQAAVNQDGSKALLVKTKNGVIMENPLIYARKRAWDQFYKAAACFGMTPADISAVKVGENPAKQEEKLKYFEKKA